MPDPFLLSRLLLRFNGESTELPANLSAVALTPDGKLWLGSDERNTVGSKKLNTIDCLSPIEPHVFGEQRSFPLKDLLNLSDKAGEIDIEGMEYCPPYLWITGSHSSKRKKPKGNDPIKDMDRLAQIETEENRYLIARIPLVEGQLHQRCPDPQDSQKELTAACMKLSEQGNLLTDALKNDPHLGSFVSSTVPSKENGFDVEGLAIAGDKIFLGLRGPVLRGWAIILEIQLRETGSGHLKLKENSDKTLYRKHFLYLDGLGVRDLHVQGEDLLILAGPTMDLAGALRLFRWKDGTHSAADGLIEQATDQLEVLFNFPFAPPGDKAEGITLFPCIGHSEALLVVYDSPNPSRRVGESAVFADVFRL